MEPHSNGAAGGIGALPPPPAEFASADGEPAVLAESGSAEEPEAATEPPTYIGAGEDLATEGSEEIERHDIERLIAELTHPLLEGRDTPSPGLAYTLGRAAARFEAWGLEPLEFGDDSAPTYLHGYTERMLAPLPDDCRLAWRASDDSDEASETFNEAEIYADFVPVHDSGGSAAGKLVFAGFGISAKGYDELRRGRIKDSIVMFVSGEPRHKRVLDGPELSPAANLYRKLDRLEHDGARGAIVVRRNPADFEAAPSGWPEGADFMFRHSWASWVGERPDDQAGGKLPALEVSFEFATELLGVDLEAHLAAIDKKGKPIELDVPELEIELQSTNISRESLTLHNAVGVVRGSDPELNSEYVIFGAHADHIGVDPRGRLGVGADDNASGTAALLEVTRALAANPPRRSVLVAVFSAEEDGLLGSQALARDLPMPTGDVVAMINLDMIGRGDKKRCVALGTKQSPDMGKVLKRAVKASKSGLREVETGVAAELFERSDHFPFHRLGLPVLFLFEQANIAKNKDYHTWRDVSSELDFVKITSVAKLAESVVRILADDDERPSPP